MPNSTLSPKSGALIGPNPSRGPPAWAGFWVDVGVATHLTAKAYMTDLSQERKEEKSGNEMEGKMI